ncbi:MULTISPECIES: hypothetical protein [Neisseria]|uniref:hypothetical protein n=1 Tax=Neisseria TaxID=482 RepID=UPI0010728E58|nr:MULTISPECIES: hypothetical protein [Neisseria]MBF0804488.1 hypothetical protein [Neisseria sp. 19428wB4_WF04]TFU40504.1 hypothetical protein E4T99_09060 [Neisseria sp. WF04]
MCSTICTTVKTVKTEYSKHPPTRGEKFSDGLKQPALHLQSPPDGFSDSLKQPSETTLPPNHLPAACRNQHKAAERRQRGQRVTGRPVP